MNNIYNIILHSNTLNFIIFMIIIIFVCKKFDVAAVIENMRNKIECNINESDKCLKEAQEKQKEAHKSSKKTEKEICDINKSATEKAEILKKQIADDTELKIQNIIDNAQKIISTAKNNTKSDLISDIGRKSIAIAKDKIIKELESNQELHNKFIEKSIEELDKAVLNDIY